MERQKENRQGNQIEEYRVLLEGGEGEITEKKSRFIATVRKCEREADAVSFIEEMKKKYWDASHNCSAFVIGSRGELTRCSDDGEPGGTAGRPMLEVLLGEEIRNVAVVVTRYFGGTLLGTGGLVRAYSQAVRAGLAACRVGVMRYGSRLALRTDYNGIGKVLHVLQKQGVEPVSSEYAESVGLTVLIRESLKQRLVNDLVEATGGKVQVEQEEELYFIDRTD
ncbi:MAG: YigZ family protein [Candidatus Gastranaerophilales bacterium]|nr:YigZ family protein [Candidatus Gastranaerophilales bacterium]